MPVIHPHLCQRRKVNLQVNTAISPKIDNEPIYADENLYRRAVDVQKMTATYANASHSKQAGPVDEITEIDRPPVDFDSFYELVPYLSLAYSEGDFIPAEAARFERPSNTNPFTHFIKIVDAKHSSDVGKAFPEFDEQTGTHTLVLPVYLPPDPAWGAGRHRRARDYTFLNERQLLVARDFLCLALPYFSEGRPTVLNGKTGSSDKMHVLITAPRCDGAAADVVSVAACYLSFSSTESVATVLEFMETEITADGWEWRGAVGQEGLEIVGRIADWEYGVDRQFSSRNKRSSLNIMHLPKSKQFHELRATSTSITPYL